MKQVLYVIITAVAVFSMPTLTAHAGKKGTENKTYKHPDCKGDGAALCGGIAYANAGGYTVKWTDLRGKGDQPRAVKDANRASYCDDISRKITADVTLGEYNVYVVPGSCAYRLEIKIASGKSKKNTDLYLTPGCQIVTSTKGTTRNNKWKSNEVDWADEVPKEMRPTKIPYDAYGYKCGKLGNINKKK